MTRNKHEVKFVELTGQWDRQCEQARVLLFSTKIVLSLSFVHAQKKGGNVLFAKNMVKYSWPDEGDIQ